MISRFNRKWTPPIPQSCPIKFEFELQTKIKPISFNDDKSIKEYTEEDIWIERKSKWSDYLKSFDIGSPSDQILEHLSKGTPLITAHTLPHGDYTNLSKGAEIVREMYKNGVTLEMIEEALKHEKESKKIEVKESKKIEVKEPIKEVTE